MTNVTPTKTPDAQQLAALNEYLSKEIHDVKGWCVPQLWQSLWPLLHRVGPGTIAEIGVFEGKFFVGLCKTFGVDRGERAVALDVFDMQQFNLDGAGHGKKDVLLQNVSKHGLPADAVSCIEVDSLALGPQEVANFLETHGKVNFFSVDGCHEVVHTVNDIEFAMQVTCNEGIIAVDDYTNPAWPGVQEAVARMYLQRDFAFVPLAVTCNKLLLCSYSYHAKYLEAIHDYIRTHHESTNVKKVKRFGFDTLTIQPRMQEWVDLSPIA